MTDTDEITALRADNERLRVENIQMRFALGYPMPAELEHHILPSNPFKCGMCDARAALATQPAPSGWRPIETAPKDGTEVLMVFVFEDGETLHRVVRWDGSEMWPWRDEYTGYREGEAKGWMPLLPAPGKEEV